MFERKFDLTPYCRSLQPPIEPGDHGVLQVQRAHSLYSQVRFRAQLRRLWGTLTGSAWRLLDLAQVQAGDRVCSRHYAGLQTVPLSRIRGSVNRSRDFDASFRPLQGHTRERWTRLAAAREAGETFPAVELIQMGNTYYVQDGHHRVSVAWAAGEKYIDAVVTVWQLAGATAVDLQLQEATAS